jgi:hypothetical protein
VDVGPGGEQDQGVHAEDPDDQGEQDQHVLHLPPTTGHAARVSTG